MEAHIASCLLAGGFARAGAPHRGGRCCVMMDILLPVSPRPGPGRRTCSPLPGREQGLGLASQGQGQGCLECLLEGAELKNRQGGRSPEGETALCPVTSSPPLTLL